MALDEAAGAVGVAGGSGVQLRRLSQRQDHNGWVIGRIDTGDFITVPDVAYRVIALLAGGVSEIGHTLAGTVDAGAALAILLGFQILWGSRWWHRHQHQVHSVIRTYLRTERR